ncbi:MAG: hypothetical protein BGO42_11930 [Flavobacterium sp. 40-81]|nr:MAG: hypothetical protein ABS44_16305 [Chryseobacterium sp. SCN 40-13]OJV68279.1 MAG: hypothetical protein BGO42_11930 [Flavobacterium sp. 40-81]
MPGFLHLKNKNTIVMQNRFWAVSIMAIFFSAQLLAANGKSVIRQKESAALSLFKNDTTSATFPGGFQSYYSLFFRNFEFDNVKDNNKEQVTVTVNFVITENGDMENIGVTGSNASANAEVLRVINSLVTHKWLPAQKNGIPVRQKLRLPISLIFGEEGNDGKDELIRALLKVLKIEEQGAREFTPVLNALKQKYKGVPDVFWKKVFNEGKEAYQELYKQGYRSDYTETEITGLLEKAKGEPGNTAKDFYTVTEDQIKGLKDYFTERITEVIAKGIALGKFSSD